MLLLSESGDGATYLHDHLFLTLISIILMIINPMVIQLIIMQYIMQESLVTTLNMLPSDYKASPKQLNLEKDAKEHQV